MAIPARFYRVPVLIFAVLAASFYVYAKAGGTLPGRRSQESPGATEAKPTFAGSKSAMVISPAPHPSDVPGYGDPAGNRPTAVFPGSKSEVIARPQDFAPPPSRAPKAATTNTAKTGYSGKPAAQRAAVPPTPPPPQYRPPNPSSAADIITMHGSKSAPMIGPETFAPSATPTGTTPYAAPSKPTTALRPLPPPEYIPPKAPAHSPRDTMGGSKSKPVFAPESFAPPTANRPYTPQPAAPQSALPQKGVQPQPSPQQSLKKAVNSWINPTNQRAASR